MEEKEANDICSFLSPPTFIANPVSTTEGTLIRTTAKEVGSSSAPRYRLPFLLCHERARGTTGRLAPAPWTGHSLSPAISNKNKTIKLLEIEWIRAQISL